MKGIKSNPGTGIFQPLLLMLILLLCASFLPAGFGPFDGYLTASAKAPGVTFEREDESGGRFYTVKDSSYRLYINDQEDLLVDEEEEELLTEMLPIASYGNAAFMTTQIGSASYEKAAGDIYHSLFGNNSSGTIFLIDMNHRQLIIYSDGAIYKVITKRYANTITDNVYGMARKGEYYDCAKEVFSEMTTLLGGQHIAQPMKHITNAMLALILSTFILYFLTRRMSRLREAKSSEILAGIGSVCHFSNGASTFVSREKVYNPHTSSDDSSFRGGGGGGGGGFSGGGGGGGGGSHGF